VIVAAGDDLISWSNHARRKHSNLRFQVVGAFTKLMPEQISDLMPNHAIPKSKGIRQLNLIEISINF
jgi:hypothetical protein